MADVPSDYRDAIDLRAVIARIDRDRAESDKLREEQRKLFAEGRKFDRDRLLAPWLAILGLVGGAITILSALARWKVWGG